MSMRLPFGPEWVVEIRRNLVPTDRLALARALVADMPGVVVAKLPEPWRIPAEDNSPYNKGRRRGWNDYYTEIKANGGKSDER